MRPLIRALSFLPLLLGFQVKGAYLFDQYQEYPDYYSNEKNGGFDKPKDNSPDKKAQCNEPVAPEFGKVLIVGNFIEVGSRAIFTCEKGRVMVGSATSKCLDSLEWTFLPPKCVKKCSVPNVYYGRIGEPSFIPWMPDSWRELPVGAIFEDDEVLKLRCDDKYEPLGKPTFEESVACKNGEWSPFPLCEPAKCRSKPPESANTTATTVNGTHGGTVVYICNPPFQKEVEETIVCEFGQWKGLLPVCKIKTQCDEPVAPEFGKVHVVGNRAIFTCEEGSEMVGSATSRCSDSFKWTFRPPKCVKKCSVPKVPHGRIGRPVFLPWMPDSWRELPVGEIFEDDVVLKLRCDDKYEPLGKPTFEESVACKYGEWSPVPHCEPVFNKEKDQPVSSSKIIPIVAPLQLPNLNTSIVNPCTCTYLSHDTNLVAYVGTKRLQSGSKVEHNSKVKFHCIPFGYSLLKGSSEIKCQDCHWDSTVFPKCESRKTGEATLHINGEWQLLPGGVVGIEKGRILSITCEANGTGIVPQWKNLTAPRIYVDTYQDHYSGRNVSMLYIMEVDAMHVGKYQCFVPGYAPNIIEIQLLTDTDSAPVKCSKLEDRYLSIRYSEEQNVGSVATVSCKNRPKTLVRRIRRLICLSDGKWSNHSLPRCKEGPDIPKPEDHPVNKKKCPNVSDENLLVDHSRDLTEGSVATFHCPPTYVLSGVDTTICTRSGEWADPIPKCLRVPGCLYPQKPIDLIIEPIKMFYRLGEIINLYCPPGKTLSFEIVRILCLSNGWSEKELPHCTDYE